MLRDLFSFLKSKLFLFNLIAGIVVAFGLIFGIRAWLASYTLHGETLTVPDLKGYTVEEADSVLTERNMNFVIQDTIYSEEVSPGGIITQNPEADKKVKKGRRIYLTVNSSKPKMVTMPDLLTQSKRLATSTMKVVDLRIEDFKFKPSNCKNCVIEQLYKGKKIEPGTKLKSGSKITLVLGMGKSDEETTIPDLSGMTIKEAEERLTDQVLDLGAVRYEKGCCPTKKDSLHAKVYKQSPEFDQDGSIRLGSSIDIWVTTDESKVKEARNMAKSKRDSSGMANSSNDPGSSQEQEVSSP